MTAKSELVAFSASALLRLDERSDVSVLATIEAHPDGSVSVIVEDESLEQPVEVLRLPAGSRVYTTEGVVAA